MKIFALCMLSFFAIIGISHIVFAFYLRLVSIKNENAIVVIKDINTCSDIEFYIRSLISKAKRSFGLNIRKIVILDSGLDDYTKKEISLLCRNHEYISVMTKEEFISS